MTIIRANQPAISNVRRPGQALKPKTSGGAVPAPSLKDGLVEWWDLKETSAGSAPVVRVGSHGGLDLNDVNTVASAAGVGAVGTSASFVAANLETLNRGANDAALQFPDASFTIALWIYPTVAANNTVLSKGNTNGTAGEYEIRFGSGGTLAWLLKYDPGLPAETIISGASSAPINTWTHVVAWFDKAAQQMGLSLNDGTPQTQARATGCQTPAAPNGLALGSRASSALYFDGREQTVGIWGKALTAAERTELYNSGAALLYADL